MLCLQKSHFEDDFDACQAHYRANVEDSYNYWGDTFSGEDIWLKFEKFEIPPTPPRSPRRTGIPLIASTADTFEMVRDAKFSSLYDYGRRDYDGFQATKWRDYIIRNDCMWGNGCSLGEKTKSPAVSNTCLEALSLDNEDKLQNDDAIGSYTAIECVNPSSVLPSVSPLTDHSHYVAKHLPIVTPTSSSACSSETGTKEEIDVVTVENKPKRRSPSPQMSLSGSPPPKRPRTTPPPSRPATPPSTTQQHKPRRDCQPRICSSASSLTGQRRASIRRSSSKNEDSENELENKRTTHNHLERKRRNDLKSSFQNLRMNVPDIKDNEKAPKVTILRKASEYILQLRRDEEKLAVGLVKETQRHESLLKQYNALNQGAVSRLVKC